MVGVGALLPTTEYRGIIMSVVKSASPIGFNIKIKNGIIFSDEEIYPPFSKNILYDMAKNPHRWNITYEKTDEIEKARQEKIEQEKVEDEKTPVLEKSPTNKSAAAIKKTAQVKAKRKKILTK